MRICHVITGLNVGGAELMLYKLLARMDRSRFEAEVIALVAGGSLQCPISALGIPVRSLGMRAGIPNPISLPRLAKWLCNSGPDIVQTWMYHADLLGGIANLAGSSHLVWNIRHSNLDPRVNGPMTMWTVRACSRLSHWLPSRIICNSLASQAIHIALGYAASKMVMIPNGFDTDRFRPDPDLRCEIRKELAIPPEVPIVTLIARFDPQKDHLGFVRAAKSCHAEMPDVHFVLCGANVSWQNASLVHWVRAAGLEDCCHLLGRRDDIPRIMAASDIVTLCSLAGESFPNVIGEAMACGVPCVVTEVGDSATIVGDTGIVVPPENPLALAQAWQKLLTLSYDERAHLGDRARRRILDRYNIGCIAKQYEKLYLSLA